MEMKPMELPPVLDYKTLQSIFGYSEKRSYALLKTPEAGAFTIGSRRFIATETFLKWLKEQPTKPNNQGGTHGNT